VKILIVLGIQLEQGILVGLGLVRANLTNWTAIYSLDSIWSYRQNFTMIQVEMKTKHLSLSIYMRKNDMF
jgi:hypothetical protein